MISKKDLKKWRKLANKASPAPWSDDDGAIMCGESSGKVPRGYGFSSIPAQYHYGDDNETPKNIDSDLDAEFICHARNTYIPLLDEVEKLRNKKKVESHWGVRFLGGFLVMSLLLNFQLFRDKSKSDFILEQIQKVGKQPKNPKGPAKISHVGEVGV